MTTLLQGTITQRLFTARGHNQIMNQIHRDTMETIKSELLPFHFMTAAYNRYPNVFVKRSKRWQMIKARVVHHQRPNEWTGALRRAVLLESVVRATATRGTLTAKAPEDSVVLSGPRAGQMQRRPLTDQRRKEMEVVGENEIDRLRLVQRDQYIAAVYDPANSEKVLKQFRV